MVGKMISTLRSFACAQDAVKFARHPELDSESINADLSVGNMNQNNFTNKVFSRFTSHFSLKRAGATHVALCDSVSSYYRHWCGAFTSGRGSRHSWHYWCRFCYDCSDINAKLSKTELCNSTYIRSITKLEQASFEISNR